MCFSPKVKMPKVNTNNIPAPTPAPLNDNAKGVQFGGSSDDTEDKRKDSQTEEDETTEGKTGKSGLKISLKKSVKSKFGSKH